MQYMIIVATVLWYCKIVEYIRKYVQLQLNFLTESREPIVFLTTYVLANLTNSDPTFYRKFKNYPQIQHDY